jgi:hypothetical protein
MGDDGSTAVVVLVTGRGELVVGQIYGRRPDLTLVDGLARLQLSALRLGCSVRLRGVCAELRGLLDLVGLDDLLADDPI